MAEFGIVEEKHPELWGRWKSYLQGWSNKMGYDERWVTYGLWRWRRHPGGIQDFIKAQNISVTPTHTNNEQGKLGISFVSGTRPCGRGGISVEGVFNNPAQIEDVANILNSVGIVKKTKGALRLWSNETDIYLFNDGRIVVNAPDERTGKTLVLKLAMTISRINRCVKCGSCISICPTASASLQNGSPFINDETCSHCGLCTKVCPVAHFDRLGELRSSLFVAHTPIAG
jgi:phosphoadenosine phosphosulfate reductase